MKSVEILSETIEDRLHVAILDNNYLIDAYADTRLNSIPQWGAIYLARVSKIDKNLNLAILDLGPSPDPKQSNNQQAILPAKHVCNKRSQMYDSKEISTLLSAGDRILIQIKAEGYACTESEGLKLPRVTMKLFFPGRFLLHSPYFNTMKVSKKVTNEAILDVVKSLHTKGSWIIRASAQNAQPDFLQKEAEHLKQYWENILTAQEKDSQTPRLLHQGANALCRALIDYSNNSTIASIECVSPNKMTPADKWCEKHAPDFINRLKISPEKEGSLFDHRDVYSEIDMLADARIMLPNGGSIIIDQAHAFTVIDINRGSAASVMSVNAEASTEIARQIKLRNISGAILIDYINMRKKTDRHRTLSFFEKALSKDPAHPQVHGFTRLGIVEMTRSRRTGSYAEKMSV